MSLFSAIVLGILGFLTLPVILFPEAAARYRYRHAANPDPGRAGVTNIRIAGMLLLGFDLVVLASILL